MYTRPTAPRSIGGVLDDAFRLYRASFVRCWPLALVGALLLGAVSIYVTGRMGSLGSQTATVAGMTAAMARLQAIERAPSVWGSYLLIMVVWLAFHAALIARQNAVAMNRADSNGEALAFGLRRLPSMIGAGILWGLAVGFGSLLLIVPGIWLWGQLQLWLVAMCAEDLGAFAALGRSWRLIEGNWWRATTTVGVAYIIILALSVSQTVIAGVAIALLRGDAATILILTQLLSVLVSVFTAPMLTVVMLALYHDLKLRREGGDLAARLVSLQTA